MGVPVMSKKRIAIVGGGVAGVSAFWSLNKYSSHEVHLFEASERLGGRIQTLPFEHNGREAIVGTGLTPFSKYASPNFCALLDHLNVPSRGTRLRFSVSNSRYELRWAYDLLKDVVFNPGVLTIVELCRTVFDIIRFNYTALDVLVEETTNPEDHLDETLTDHASKRTVREYLVAEGFSDGFRDNYLRPFLGIMWNTTAADTLLDLPIGSVVRLMYDHGFLGLSAFVKSPWQTIRSGGFDFMDAMIESFPAERIHPNSRIVEATRRRKDDGVSLCTANNQWHHFDHIIFTIPGEAVVQIAQQLIDPYDRALLRRLRVTRNLAVLHSDASLMPTHERSWSSCNYITSSDMNTSTESSPASSITYSLNSIQQLPESIYGRLFVTLNPFAPPHPQHVQAVWEFTDFEIDSETLRARDQLLQTNSKVRKNVSFCAHYWMGHGFYEDAATSGLIVAAQLGANTPFQLIDHASMDRQAISVQSFLLDKIVWVVLELIHLCILSLQVLVQLLQLVRLPKVRSTRRQGRPEGIQQKHGKQQCDEI